MDCGKPQVAAANAQSPLRFQVVQKGHDQWCIDLREIQV